MKKHILCTAIASAMVIFGGALLLSGCQKEKEEFLDLDVSSLDRERDDMTKQQWDVFQQATARLDPFISYDGEQYVMKEVKASNIGLSQRLFDYLKSRTAGTNTMIRSTKAGNFIYVEVRPKVLRLIKTDEVFFLTKRINIDLLENPGGITDFEVKWWGVQVYLSNEFLVDFAGWCGVGGTTSGVAARIATNYPALTTFAADLVLALAFNGAVAYTLSEAYPEGVIITKPWISPIWWPQSQNPE